MANYLADLYKHDLLLLMEEVKKFHTEDNLWQKPAGIKNSAGTLVRHLTGCVIYRMEKLTGINSVRDKKREFSPNAMPRQELIDEIENTIKLVKNSLRHTNLEVMEKKDFHYHNAVLRHFNYHLGQINYLRRILEQADS